MEGQQRHQANHQGKRHPGRGRLVPSTAQAPKSRLLGTDGRAPRERRAGRCTRRLYTYGQNRRARRRTTFSQKGLEAPAKPLFSRSRIRTRRSLGTGNRPQGRALRGPPRKPRTKSEPNGGALQPPATREHPGCIAGSRARRHPTDGFRRSPQGRRRGDPGRVTERAARNRWGTTKLCMVPSACALPPSGPFRSGAEPPPSRAPPEAPRRQT